jgi:peptidoglycan biosynthesis protein MviN/MurJ (putative lipid II flippase)
MEMGDGEMGRWETGGGRSRVRDTPRLTLQNAWGLFQEYYTTHLFPERTASEVAWIGSLQYLLIYLPSVLMGRLVDTSRFYYPFWAASVLYPVSVFLTAQVKEYWQAVLAHGLMFGGTAGMLFCPAIAVVTQWCE